MPDKKTFHNKDKSKKKILLINPAPRKITTKVIPKNLPLALLSVASTLVNDYDVIILDRAVEKDDGKLGSILEDSGLICVGISSLTGPIIIDGIYCSQRIKALRPDIPVVWGGWHATKVPESILGEPCIDFVIQGEGEFIFRAFIDALSEPHIQRKLPGVGFKEGEKICLNPPEPPLNMSLQPPLPLYLIDDIEPYVWDNWVPEGNRCICWETSRGCPFSCTFCDISYYFGKSYSYHTPQRMIEDVKWLHETHGIEGIRFYDPNFFFKIDRIIEFCELLIRENINIKWAASGTIIQFRHISKELLQFFYNAGLRCVEFGIESGDERTRKDILNKRFSNDDCEKVIRCFQGTGLQFKFNIMVGFPGELYEQTLQSVDFALNILMKYPNSSIGGHIYMYIPLPGTGLYKRARNMGYVLPNNLEGYGLIDYSNPQLVPWLMREQRKAIEAISIMSYFLSAPAASAPFHGIKRLLFKLFRSICIVRLKKRLFLKTPDIVLLRKILH